jgi:hypothetical protein
MQQMHIFIHGSPVGGLRKKAGHIGLEMVPAVARGSSLLVPRVTPHRPIPLRATDLSRSVRSRESSPP